MAILEYYTINENYTAEGVLAVAKEAAGDSATVTDAGGVITVETSDGNIIDITSMIGSSVNYEGCYADVDGDGNPDGIIFADLAYMEHIQ